MSYYHNDNDSCCTSSGHRNSGSSCSWCQNYDDRCQAILQQFEMKFIDELELFKRRRKLTNKNTYAPFGVQKRVRAPEQPLPESGDEYVQDLRRAIFELTKASGYPIDGIQWQIWGQYFYLDRAIVHILFADKKYKQVQEACRLMKIPPNYERELDSFWHESSYRIEQAEKGKYPTTPVHKYRIRTKNPSPTESKIYRIGKNARIIMRKQFEIDPKPGILKRKDIAKITGLTYYTVTNWFKNHRQRDKRPDQVELRQQASSALCAPIPCGLQVTQSQGIESQRIESQVTEFHYNFCQTDIFVEQDNPVVAQKYYEEIFENDTEQGMNIHNNNNYYQTHMSF